jgi:hypothetical protein
MEVKLVRDMVLKLKIVMEIVVRLMGNGDTGHHGLIVPRVVDLGHILEIENVIPLLLKMEDRFVVEIAMKMDNVTLECVLMMKHGVHGHLGAVVQNHVGKEKCQEPEIVTVQNQIMLGILV